MNQRFLILNFESPMMAFGNEATENRRPTAAFPGRSMITGLMANALGWHRTEYARMQELQQRILYAARRESTSSHPPEVLWEYQTALIGKDDQVWTTNGTPQKRAGSRDTYDFPEPRSLEYLTGLRVVIALRLQPPDDQPNLDQIAQALEFPARPLFIGRKTCLPSNMIMAGWQEAENATSALYQVVSKSHFTLDQVIWDDGDHHPSITKTHEEWTSDLRDWANRVHTGRRTVCYGTQTTSKRDRDDNEATSTDAG